MARSDEESGALEDLESKFIDEVADWLLARRDPRLSFEDGKPRINDLIGACIDFCRFMEEITGRGIPSSEWRNHV